MTRHGGKQKKKIIKCTVKNYLGTPTVYKSYIKHRNGKHLTTMHNEDESVM